MKSKQAKRHLSKRQLAVIDDLFEGAMEQSQLLAKHGLKKTLYQKWLADAAFAGELEFRIESARLQGRLILAKYAPVAAAKLVALTEAEKEETVRRACLDVISVQIGQAEMPAKAESQETETPCEEISPAAATKILKILATEKI